MSKVSLAQDSGDNPPRKRRRPEPTPAQRALGLLVRREHSRTELLRKLAARGVEEAEAEQAVDRMRREGWQDDARFAASLARARASGGYGPLRITAELGMHGIETRLVDEAFASLAEAGEDDWTAHARGLLERRYGEGLRDRAIRRKAADFLVRRGFDAQTAHEACGANVSSRIC